MEIILKPIGVIHTPFDDPEQAPIQSSRSTALGWLEILPEFGEGLRGIEGFSHLFLFYHFHSLSGYSLSVQPFLDDKSHGIFATRHPRRPNGLGFSVVRLLRQNGLHLDFEGADMLNGTPLLDIKPYLPDFDQHPATKFGWYENRTKI